MMWSFAALRQPFLFCFVGLLIVGCGETELVVIEEQKLTGDSWAFYFGGSVAVSGDTAVIGAYGDDDNDDDDDDDDDLGAAHVFVRSGTTWTQQQKLRASDAAAYDYFGYSVAVSGDIAVIGVRRAAHLQGSAYVFVRSGTSWTQQQELAASAPAFPDGFGYSVAVSGDTVVIGASNDADAGSGSGSAYVFVRSGTTWVQQQKLAASDAAADDHFGYSVAVSGDTVVIGTVNDADAGSGSGSAYVFVRNGTSWTQQQKLTASDPAFHDAFGSLGNLVAVSDDTAVIGVRSVDDAGGHSGLAYVFMRSGTTWTEAQKLITGDATRSDYLRMSSVAVSGDTVVVGTRCIDITGGGCNGTTLSGSVSVFVRSGTTWNRQQRITASQLAAGEYFGGSVAVSGDTVVVGATTELGSRPPGAAHVFRVRDGD